VNVLSPILVKTVEPMHQANHWNVRHIWRLQQIVNSAIQNTAASIKTFTTNGYKFYLTTWSASA